MAVTAIITGGSSGIGAATAKLFAARGYDVLLIARDQTRLNRIQEEILNLPDWIDHSLSPAGDDHPHVTAATARPKVETLAMDLTEFEEALFFRALEKLGPPGVLVNNAGIYEEASNLESSTALWERMFHVNLLGSVKITQSAWKIFSAAAGGAIVNVSSTLGVKPVSRTSAYSAMKAAMINWTLSLAQEGGAMNIRANCVCPGIIDTPIQSFHKLPTLEKTMVGEQIGRLQLLNRLGKPADIAEAIYFLSSDQARFTTGAVLNVDGGINIK